MMDRDRQRRFRRVFKEHDDAIRALREANTAMGAAVAAHDAAIQAALDANRAAIDLLNDLSQRDDNA
jgi:hypothetical protein